MSSVDTCLRFVHYVQHRAQNALVVAVARLDAHLQQPQAKVQRVALAALFYFGALLVAATLTWKWVAICYAIQTLLDMYISPRPAGQRWDDIMLGGLNFGLAIRASVLVISGLYGRALLQTLKGVLLAGSVFFRQDLDQYDWIAYVQPLHASIRRTLSSAASSALKAARAWSGSKKLPHVASAPLLGPAGASPMVRPLQFAGSAPLAPTPVEGDIARDAAAL